MFKLFKNKKEAQLEALALEGGADAQYQYASYLLSSNKGDNNRAMEFYVKAAKQGHAYALEFASYQLVFDAINYFDEQFDVDSLANVTTAVELCHIAVSDGKLGSDTFPVKFCPFVEHLHAILTEYYQEAIYERSPQAIYSIVEFLYEDPDKDAFAEECGLDYTSYTALLADILQEAADSGYAPAVALMRRIG